MDALLAFAVAETQAAAALGDGSSMPAQPEMLMSQVGAHSLQCFPVVPHIACQERNRVSFNHNVSVHSSCL